MPTAHRHPLRLLAGLLAAMVILLAGCGTQPRVPVYHNEEQGLRFTPPPGWSERARNQHVARVSGQERLLVQYKRLQAGNPAWLRVSVADLPRSTSLATYLVGRSPGCGWRRESSAQKLEVNGLPAVRVAFAGRSGKNDLFSETVAVRQAEHVYLFTGVVPASDNAAREQVRRAVASAAWARQGLSR